ncbi:MAG: alpha/beta fold hydrolase [Dehalococcoidia bacterium]
MTPLYFLPGASGRADFWAPVARQLEDLGPAHLFGWPGFAGNPVEPEVTSLGELFGWFVARLPDEPCDVIAQSMGGVLAVRLAIECPERVRRLVLVATSGGVDVTALGGEDWRKDYAAELPDVPPWFADDRTDMSGRLGEVRAPTLLLWSDADPISPLAVGRFLAGRIAGSRLEVIPGGTHLFAEERPDETAAAIRAHLGGDETDQCVTV